jgi:hypothetical protein
MPPMPASALPAKGAKSAKGARTRKVQRDMTIVHERKTTAANEASKISKNRLSLQLDAIVRSSTSVDKKVIQNNQAPLLTRVTLSCAGSGTPCPTRP